MPAFFKFISIILIVFASVLGFLVVTPFQSMERHSRHSLVIGLESGYPPFEFRNAQGKLVGFDLDVAEKIAAKLEKKLIIKDMEFDGEILSLKQGKIDLIISGMNITPSRLKHILMVPYYGEATSTLSLIFWNEIPPDIHSLDDIAKLPNPVISVKSATIPETVLSHYEGIHTKSFLEALSALMDVKYGKSIAQLVEPDVADYLKKQHPEIRLLNVPLKEKESISGFGIGVKKENQELYQQIQDVVFELKASGELKELEDKWFKGAK